MVRRLATPALAHLTTLALGFTLLSLAYSMATWGLGTGRPWQPHPDLNLFVHGLSHSLAGAVLVLPARRWDLILLGAAMPVLIDIDHFGLLFGWPVLPRASHSLGFLLLAPVALGFIATRLGHCAPLLVAAVAMGGVAAHITWDTLATPSGMPFWFPLEPEIVKLPGWLGLLLGLAAAASIALAHRAREHVSPPTGL